MLLICEAAEGANAVGMFMIMIFSSDLLVVSDALTPIMYCPGVTLPVTMRELPWKVSPEGNPEAVNVTGGCELMTLNW